MSPQEDTRYGGDWTPPGERGRHQDETWPTIVEPEERPRTARERRVTRDNRRDRVRSSLRVVSDQYGYHVFENVMTEAAGAIDFLAVGPVGTVVVIVRDEEGVVSAAEDGTLLLDGRPFEDDPRQHVNELADDVVARVAKADGACLTQICFTRADVEYPDNLELMRGICTTWTLAWPFSDRSEEECTAADVAEFADEVERVYGRPPFVRPAGTGP